VWDSLWDSVWAYMGYIFKDCIIKWKNIDHKQAEYPF